MIGLAAGTSIWLVAGHTDVRNGSQGLAVKVVSTVQEEPLSGHQLSMLLEGMNWKQPERISFKLAIL